MAHLWVPTVGDAVRGKHLRRNKVEGEGWEGGLGMAGGRRPSRNKTRFSGGMGAVSCWLGHLWFR